MLRPISAMRLLSTSGIVSAKSITGVMTFSQSGRKTRPWWWRGPGMPGPSKASTV